MMCQTLPWWTELAVWFPVDTSPSGDFRWLGSELRIVYNSNSRFALSRRIKLENIGDYRALERSIEK